MPLEICKFANKRIKICKRDFETAWSQGWCASQNRKSTTKDFDHQSVKFYQNLKRNHIVIKMKIIDLPSSEVFIRNKRESNNPNLQKDKANVIYKPIPRNYIYRII